MDFRFQSSLVKFLAEKGLQDNYDLFSIAGSQKNFLAEETKEIALRQVELTQKLHGATEVYLIAHWDCGAYGGSATLGGGLVEKEKYATDLASAKAAILDKFPEFKVYQYLAMLESDGSIHYDAI